MSTINIRGTAGTMSLRAAQSKETQHERASSK